MTSACWTPTAELCTLLWVPRTLSRRLISTFAASHARNHSRTPASMIARCGFPTHVPDARPRAELAGAPRPIERNQGRRDPGPPSRNRRTSTTQFTPRADVGMTERSSAHWAGCYPRRCAGWAGVPEDPAALARPSRRPPLDLPATPTGSSTHRPADPCPRAADGPRESDMGLPTHPGRTRRTRPPARRLRHLEDFDQRRHRPRSVTVRPDLAAIPYRPGATARLTLLTARGRTSGAQHGEHQPRRGDRRRVPRIPDPCPGTHSGDQVEPDTQSGSARQGGPEARPPSCRPRTGSLP